MNLTLLLENDRINMQFTKGERLKDILHRNNIAFDMPCGGNGICGKCRIHYLKGAPLPVLEERTLISDEDILNGWRLACATTPETDCEVEMSKKPGTMDAVTEFTGAEPEHNRRSLNGIAIDLGTTTIAFALVQEGKVVDTCAQKNSQSVYGADVISRIHSASEGKQDEMRSLVQKDLVNGINSLVKHAYDTIDEVVIAGNTTMLHLLLGYSCQGLGSTPFEPVNLKEERRLLSEVLPDCRMLLCDTPVTIFPGISTFVGSDIVSGLFYLEADKWEKPTLFVDLGTNGEMAVGTAEHLLVSSAAAGPAFEGGNLSCGTGSVEGAICSVEFRYAVPKVKTIGDAKPVGICGTGIVEALYGMRKNGYMDATGLLREPYFSEGFSVYSGKSVFARTMEEELHEDVKITQKDIRELQMAKSAVRTGIETLIRKSGYQYKDIRHVYLAGGFGYRLDIGKAAGIGLIPEELAERTEAVGNTALGGTAAFLLAGNDREKSLGRLSHLAEVSEEVTLAEETEFGDDYMKYMFF